MIKDALVKAKILRGIEHIMYNTCCPTRTEMNSRARSHIQDLAKDIPKATEFWVYFQKEWGTNTLSGVVGDRNLCYAGQDTNATIESYHTNLKAMVRQSKGCYHSRRVDWTIHQLVGDVLNHCWNMALQKQHVFVINKGEKPFVMCALWKARLIPDALCCCHHGQEGLPL